MNTSSLVSIQPVGTKRPLFLVHPAGGNVFSYLPLAHQLGQDQPVYGLQAVGLYSEQTPHTTIEEMAAHYIEEMRALQPEGPYQIGGWSLGGVIAFEMAQQLRQLDQEVSLLALIDSGAPDSNDEPLDIDREVLELVDWIVREAGSVLDIHDDTLRSLMPEERLSYVLEQVRLTDRSRLSTSLSEVALPQTERLLRIQRSNNQALAGYIPQKYPGKVTFFRASEMLGDAEPSAAYKYAPARWQRLADDFVLQMVSGNHQSIMTEPLVQLLAEQLKADMDDVKRM
ncbi:thioesterase domain-containing protein [Dictyobacter vulcani]